MSLASLIKRLQDIMRKDSGVDGDAQRLAQIVWLIFLKVYDYKEKQNSMTIMSPSFRKDIVGVIGLLEHL